MEDEKQPPAAAATVSKVLDDDDLFIEILLRVGFPTTLVRAALVCKRWLGHISNRAFLHRFRELHPPRLLGFYIEDRALPYPPRFVPMFPQPPELAAVVRRARFGLEACNLPPDDLCIRECRNGSIFIHWYEGTFNISDLVYSPLCPQRGLTILPSLPLCGYESNMYCTMRQVLPQEDGDDFGLYVESTRDGKESEFRVKVYRLQDGCWHETFRFLDMGKLPHPRRTPESVLMDNKIYMPAGLSEIIILDLTASSLSTIQYPSGVDHHWRGTTLLSRAGDASGLYLFHSKEFQLHMWLHKGDNWMLVDTICLGEMIDNLKRSGCTIEDEGTPRLMSQMVDNGDFLFLTMGGCVLHLDIKSRTLCKVYETEEGYLGGIHPFMMIWRPLFPALKYESARFVFRSLDDLYAAVIEVT